MKPENSRNTRGVEAEKGSLAFENWQASLGGSPERSVLEYPLFTDARLEENLRECGPYHFFGTQNHHHSSNVASVVLRVHYYLDSRAPDMQKTDVGRYHGGGLQEELAALVSLCLGVRLKAGGLSRYFLPDKDPKGYPLVTYEGNPTLLKTHRTDPVLPQALGAHDLSQAVLLRRFAEMRPRDSVALARAARLYQDAVWISETEPQLSWIMLVSAVETAANHWREARESALDRLRASQPALAQLLSERGGESLLLEVAEHVARYMGATRKFLDFLNNYLPEPPAVRPSEEDRHSWEHNALERSLKVIYDWRSRALHGGTPIPHPMCDEAMRSGDGWAETGTRYASGALGGVWTAKDVPMRLHLFEHIVRGALLHWWSAMLSVSLPTSTTDETAEP